MFISYATGTTDVCALQKHLTMLTNHKGLWCSLGMMLYRHLLAYIQMLKMTLFKPLFVDAVFPFMLFAYEPCPSLPHRAAHQSLPPSLFLLQSPLHRVSHELAKVPSLPFPSWIPSLPSSFFAFMELQALQHCVNQSKECFPLKSNSLPHHFGTPHTSSRRAGNSKHCPTTPICFILNGPIKQISQEEPCKPLNNQTSLLQDLNF